MNERIKQLAAKANFGHMEKNEVVYDSRLEKFAQLIVAECMKLNSKELSFTAIERLLSVYEEHFGVEE